MSNDSIKKKGKGDDLDEGDQALSDDADPGEDELDEEEDDELDTDWTDEEKEY